MGRVDVLVVGGGPAGRALAAACARLGLATGLLDPAPDRPWTATYGMWAAELPRDLPPSVVAARAAGRAVALTEHRLGWEYAVLDVPALRAHLDGGLAGVAVHAGRAIGSPAPGVVALADGSFLRAAVVVDAGGRVQPLTGGAAGTGVPRARSVPGAAEPGAGAPAAGAPGDGVPGPAAPRLRSGAAGGRPRILGAPGGPAEQTAYGLVVDQAEAAPIVAPGEALFMDWRPDHGEPGWPTFLYAVPLGPGPLGGRPRVLLEETSLARRPGLPLPVLRRRLLARLARHGVAVPPDARSEKVSFPVDRPRHRSRTALGFGAAAPLVHPASGFSLAASLRLAPEVAAALAAYLPADPAGALAAARTTVWSPAARVVHRFRRIGLEALLRMPPADVPAFFEVFLALPERHRWSYLTSRDDVLGTVATMNALFRASNGTLRRHLVAPALLPPLRTNGAAPIG